MPRRNYGTRCGRCGCRNFSSTTDLCADCRKPEIPVDITALPDAIPHYGWVRRHGVQRPSWRPCCGSPCRVHTSCVARTLEQAS